MNCGCLHTQFSSSAFLHSEGRNACLKSDLLKPSTQQGLSSLDSLKSSCSSLSLQLNSRISSECSTHVRGLVIKCSYPQNADPPPYHSKKEKKPFPIPIGQGLVVQRLIPVAYRVLNARIMLINNLKKLLKVIPINACKWCSEIRVRPVGHPFKSCRGPQASIRRGVHEWREAVLEDILVPVEDYHLYDRLGTRISHEERFSITRIPAVVELCIQARVDLPEYPAKRRRKPIIRIGKKEFIDADESELPDRDAEAPKPEMLVRWHCLLGEHFQAGEEMREGSKRLMKMYPVSVCGYCPEVHMGPTGHKAQNCGAHKRQQRSGQHGWQAAILYDLNPPKYVWHVPDVNKPSERELRNFYGQAPAILELCVEAGAAVPEQYKPTMKLDVGIPKNVSEAEVVV
ncbi:hypothetical protein CDL12_09679 [Handroanthus impetiginosus]|uniref:APO domain-containing protein n=1 Tax=Handroanthus impetiginosus TaxID=429701 RepID=A0A2G9HJD8_9LAMI|nr:hypothetical protein CDL12_09679 [Handroanthus impetiginosus]